MPDYVKCVASNDIHASDPHLIPTSPCGGGGGGGGGGVGCPRNNDRCIMWEHWCRGSTGVGGALVWR